MYIDTYIYDLSLSLGALPTHKPLPPTTADHAVTPTTNTTTTPPTANTYDPIDGGAASSTRSISLVKLIFIAILLIHFSSC